MTGSKQTALLLGIAGSHNAFSLSVYNLKAFAYADAAVRSAWNIEIIQHPLITAPHEDEKIPALAEAVAKSAPDLVGLSCYMWNINAFRKLAAMLRTRLPEARLLWGGPEMATDYLAAGRFDDLEMDYCISGEGERTFIELLNYTASKLPALKDIPGLSYRLPNGAFAINGKRTPFASLMEVPSPFLTGVVGDDVLSRPRVEGNVETQRGCNLRCSYCVYHKDMSRISYSSAGRVLDEVRYLVNKGVRRIRFVDANFTSDLDHAKTVMRGLIEAGFETQLMFELIPGFIDEEFARLMGDFNRLHAWNDITVGVGVQSINLEVLKRIRRKIRLEKFIKTFALVQQNDVFAKIDLIIGLPGEDMASIERTLEYMLDTLRHGRRHLLCCHVMRGLPGTELLEIAKQHGMVFSSRYEPHELIESPALPRRDMLKCLRRTAVIFRLTNHKGWSEREFISERRSDDVSIREAFFDTRERLGISNLQLVDSLVEGLMTHLDKKSWFVQPDFPHAETWWWNYASHIVSNKWLLRHMRQLSRTGAWRSGARTARAGARGERRAWTRYGGRDVNGG